MSFNLLFSPLTVGSLKLGNRIVMAPVRETLASDEGTVTTAFTDYYLRRAQGGAALIIIGAVAVYPRLMPLNLMISNDQYVPGLKRFVDDIHQKSDAKVCAQLFQLMKMARGWIQDVQEVTADQIGKAILSFQDGAVRAREAGFDAIEMHAAHGYILAEFLSLRNKRTDGYGNHPEGRMALITQVYERIRAAAGADYPVGVRIDGDEFIVGGNSLKQSTLIAVKLARMGVDYISISAGGKFHDSPGTTPSGVPFSYPPVSGYSGFRAMPAGHMPEGVNVYLAAEIKAALVREGLTTPVMTAGRISNPQFAEGVLKDGKADLIGLCRPLIRDPEWPAKVREDRIKAIKKCEFCNECTESIRNDRPAYCKHDPLAIRVTEPAPAV